MFPCCFQNEFGERIQERQDEVVGMLGFDAQIPQDLSRKVGEIQGDDYACAAANGGGEDVPVVPIWQFYRIDKGLIAGHKGIGRRLVHEASSPFQFVACDVRPILQEIPYPFIVDFGRPMGAEDARQCEVHEEVPQTRGIENICVEEGPEYRHESDPDLLVVGGQFVERSEPFGMDLPLVGHHGLEATRRWVPTLRYSILPSSSI